MASSRRDLPAGTITFLFTDVEGSTRLLDQLGAERYAAALHEHRRLLRAVIARRGGVEVDTEGDAFFVAFARAQDAVEAADEVQRALAAGPIRVRMGIHTGTPLLTPEGYVGSDVHLGARICAIGHGGQVLLTATTRTALDGTLQLTDLGEHRLKDFAQPVWVHQLGIARFPPLKSISNTNLPRPASAFVGRERAVAEIGELLRDGARLLTLTGPGGTGKTRLSIEVATQLVSDFRNGTFWVPLAALRNPALVIPTIAATIGARDGLAGFIGDRQMLLVVDNLEHLVTAAPELATLVEACPNIRLLATSRERLRVRGETEYAVPPLSDPEAVALFGDRSGLVSDPRVGELCRRLDNLPLAIELAAARAQVLSPAQILERLAQRLDLLKGGRDAEARQATLRATIEWSHELLTPDEQRLFARLAVFHGGWVLEVAEQVCDADIDVLGSLVDKNLVRRRNDRFGMLETIREFAAERLEASGESGDLRRRHAVHYLAFAEAVAPRLETEDARRAGSLLDDEVDNLRAALAWLIGSDNVERATRLVVALRQYWHYRGQGAEAEQSLDALLPYVGRVPPELQLRVFAAASSASLFRSDPDIDKVEQLATRRLQLAEQVGSHAHQAGARIALATVANARADRALARSLLREALELARNLGPDVEFVVVNNLGFLELDDGRPAEAVALLRDAVATARRLGHLEFLAASLLGSARAEIELGARGPALASLRESLELSTSLGHVWLVDGAIDLAVITYVDWGVDDVAAAKLIGLKERLVSESGIAPLPQADASLIRSIDALRRRLGDVAFAEAVSAGRSMSMGSSVDEILGPPGVASGSFA